MTTKGKSKAPSAPARPASGKNPTVEMVRQLARILDTHNLSELVLKSADANVTLRRGATGVPMAAPPPAGVAAVMPPAASLPAAAATPPSPAPSPAAEVDDAHVVTSPFVGTFYRSPNPESPPYVSVGDRIEHGAVLCIVEAMKLMNEIEADASGEVVAILVENGDAVEFGQPLFKIKS